MAHSYTAAERPLTPKSNASSNAPCTALWALTKSLYDSPRTRSGHTAPPPGTVMNSRRFMAARSFDHFVGAGEQRRRHFEAERLRGRQVDHKLVLCRRLHRQVGRLLALEDAVDVRGRLPILIEEMRT